MFWCQKETLGSTENARTVVAFFSFKPGNVPEISNTTALGHYARLTIYMNKVVLVPLCSKFGIYSFVNTNRESVRRTPGGYFWGIILDTNRTC